MALIPKTDSAKAQKGVWIEWVGGIELCIAWLGNAAYQADIEAALAPSRNAARLGAKLKTSEIREPMMRAVAKHVLLDWRGVDDDNGEPLKYSPEVGLSYLIDEEYREFSDFVLAVAGDAALYRAEQVAEVGKP